MEEAGIPIDIIGGTSIGSFVGGLYARDGDPVAMFGRAKMFSGRMTSVWRQVFDLTYPITAWFTGRFWSGDKNLGIYLICLNMVMVDVNLFDIQKDTNEIYTHL